MKNNTRKNRDTICRGTGCHNEVYIGMDVHKESYTICGCEYESDIVKHIQKIPSDCKNMLKYVDRIRMIYGNRYDAGCVGYLLYH